MGVRLSQAAEYFSSFDEEIDFDDQDIVSKISSMTVAQHILHLFVVEKVIGLILGPTPRHN